VLDGAVPEPILNCPRVMPFVRQRVAAGMSQHVHMDFEREVGALADALDQPVNGIGGEWGPVRSGRHICVRFLQTHTGEQMKWLRRLWRNIKRLFIDPHPNEQDGYNDN
jgi:hypothetical protein